MKLKLFLCCLLLINLFVVSADAQSKANTRGADANQNTVAPPDNASSETAKANANYVYEFVQPNFVIPRVRIEHDADGRGVINLTRRNQEAEVAEKVQVSPLALARINALLDKLNFVISSENYQTEKDFSHLGTTTLSVTRDGKTRHATFNYTANPDARALADEYRRIMEQTLFVYDINNAREARSLDSPSIMKRLELLVARNGISDLAQLAPLLKDLSTDERLPLIARNKADKLLKKAAKN